MINLFQKTSSHWVRHSEYEFKENDGSVYLKPTSKSKPIVYDPLKESDNMVLDALNVGMLQMNRARADKVKDAIFDFISKYGLLGFITALPTTPHFMDYDAVYLPKNHFVKSESVSTDEYTALFFRLKNRITQKRKIKRNGILPVTVRCSPLPQPLAMHRWRLI